jgi:hypothetical protein
LKHSAAGILDARLATQKYMLSHLYTIVDIVLDEPEWLAGLLLRVSYS